MQGQAADLNLLQERITTSSDPSQMDYDIQSFLVSNEKEAFEAEQIFYDVKSLREKVASLERDIQQVHYDFWVSMKTKWIQPYSCAEIILMLL